MRYYQTMSHGQTENTSEAVWRNHADALRGFLSRRIPPETVDDLLQDIFVKIHLKLPTLKETERINGWIYQIARNAIVDHFRASARVPDEGEVAEMYLTDDDSSREELEACVAPFIDRLPDTYRDAVRMSELEGLTQAEVAKRLGLSLSGAKSRVQRGRAIAERMLDDCCVFQRDARGRVADFERRDQCACEDQNQATKTPRHEENPGQEGSRE